jgi:hypothetical protein
MQDVVKKKLCHHMGTDVLFYIGHTAIYGGQYYYIQDELPPYDLILDCTNGKFWGNTFPYFPESYAHLKQYLASVVSLPWPDFGIPTVKLEFWGELIKCLPVGNVAVCCEGGHGRTGTALAALLIASNQKTAKEAVLFLRRRYCKEAVETESQLEYLVQLEQIYQR